MPVFKKANIILGHYGCGKTNFAANGALQCSDSAKTAVIDLDTVNPYFRADDFKKIFSDKKIDLYSMNFANTNLDIPSFNFEPGAVINSHEYTFIDVGGDDSGAFALGRFSGELKKMGDNAAVFCVVNMYRDTRDDVSETLSMLNDIQKAARMECTAIVNNSNLGVQTDMKTVLDSLEFAQEVSAISGLPIAFTCVDKKFKNNKELKKIPTEIFFTERIVKLPWETKGNIN